MLSTAIPARLEFQCGHAALVSLPRIKGESSTQRNARVAREKSEAQLRDCDFCGPRTTVMFQSTPTVSPSLPPPVEEAAQAVVSLVDASLLPAAAVIAPLADQLPTPPQLAITEVLSTTKPRRQTAPFARRPSKRKVAAGQRFTMSLRLERVVAATDIRDALRQAQAFDALELVSISRER